MTIGAFVFWQFMDRVHSWIALHQDEKVSPAPSSHLSFFPGVPLVSSFCLPTRVIADREVGEGSGDKASPGRAYPAAAAEADQLQPHGSVGMTLSHSPQLISS
ncbi:hypothetical protein CDL15_Pgr024449 [Punica granatum]|uniref:Uncharacterized protein n=1 Tax=Punica granatum TaxID=22663 RepID=A0A218XYV7_PUNGR|nr:hypothetical protein CDL15_Pgr024449 [Punica granatum]